MTFALYIYYIVRITHEIHNRYSHVVVSSVRILLPLGQRLALEYFVNYEFSLSPRSIMNRVVPNCHWTWPLWAILLTVIHAMVNVPHVTSQC